jgi:GR25 family glycosyltransferase involved in LPS biosynthesis
MAQIVPFVKTWSGVDGRKLDLKKLQEQCMVTDKPMKRGVIGCFFSHRRIWQLLVKYKIKQGLIMEDDAKWAIKYTDARALVTDALLYLNRRHPNWDILLLGRNPRKRENKEQITRNIVKTGTFWGLFSYVISNSGACKLVQKEDTRIPEKPCDVLVSDLATAGSLEVFALSTEACTYITQLKSDTFRII